ncbi:TetR/AcrR family transcriptional regulator [Nocardia sp. NPDC057227]|uniref:TetR/AcrR family transcriptional regulator n=1 Tax=Nocardia sp. NPDC057227 TaxID=3346056 RepID=UPI0036332024
MHPARKYPKGEAKREAIIDAARELVDQRGWNAVTIRELAAKVGLGTTTVTHHIGSKDELLIELLRRRDRPHDRDWDGRDPDEGLRTMLTGLEENRRVSGLRELYIRLSAEATTPEHTAHEFFADRFRQLEAVGTRVFTELRDTGRIPQDADPATIATMVVALIDGLELQSFFRPEIDVVTQIRAFLQLLLGTETTGPQ